MASYEETRAAVEALVLESSDTKDKVTKLIVKIEEQKDMIAQLQAQGQGATPDQLDQIKTLAEEALANVQGAEGAADAGNAPAPENPPA